MENPIKVSEKIFTIIEILSENGPQALLEISVKLNIHKSTVHRILKSLIHMAYVKQDNETGKYSLTFKLLGISENILKHMDIVEIVKPYLKKLSDITKETVHLVKYMDNQAIYIDKVDSFHNSVRMVSKVGESIPFYCSAVGKALMSHTSDENIEKKWENTNIIKFTINTITDLDKYKKEISDIRKNGYALDNEENEIGVRCIGVSFQDYKGEYCYAISISGPINRMTNKKIKEISNYIKNTKEEIETEIANK